MGLGIGGGFGLVLGHSALAVVSFYRYIASGLGLQFPTNRPPPPLEMYRRAFSRAPGPDFCRVSTFWLRASSSSSLRPPMEPAHVSWAALAAVSLGCGADSDSQTRRAVTRWGCFYISKGLGVLQAGATPSTPTPRSVFDVAQVGLRTVQGKDAISAAAFQSGGLVFL